MKLAIVGSRTFDDYHFFQQSICKKFIIPYIDCIVSGGAKGTDTLAEKFAHAHEIPTMIFLPEWDKYKRLAGYIRNEKIIKYADEVIAFWDGKSRGTKSSIDLAKKECKPMYIIYFEEK